MLVGTPVIAADDGGNREIIADGKTGLLVRPDDSDAFARAALTLLGKTHLAQRLARSAQRHAAERFCEKKHVSTLVDIYMQIRSRP
jgi:glycosyltransferase involved in cell wall biosynthesis